MSLDKLGANEAYVAGHGKDVFGVDPEAFHLSFDDD